MKSNKIILIVIAALMIACIFGGCGLLSEDTPKPTQITTATPSATVTEEQKASDNYVSSNNTFSVQLTDPLGNIYEDEAGKSSLLSVVLGMTENAAKVDYLGLEVDINKFYTAKFFTDKGSVEYKFYFSGNPETSYFESNTGRFFSVNFEGCSEFLKTEFAEGAYLNSQLPALSIGGKELKPVSITWEYRKLDGTYTPTSDVPVYGGGEALGTVPANFTPQFTVSPDEISVVVKNGENTVYDDTIGELCNLQFKNNMNVSIALTAKWNKNGPTGCFGEAHYSFTCSLTPSASFTLDRTTAKPGEFVILSSNNPSAELDKISITNNAGIDYIPEFYVYAGKLTALLPIPLNLNASSVTYTVTAYGAVSEFKVTLTPRTGSGAGSGYVSMMAMETLDKVGFYENPYTMLYSSLKNKIAENTTFSRVYAISDFKSPYTHKEVILRAVFSQSYKFNSSSGNTDSHIAYDNIYVGYSYMPITAMAAGKVVFVGTTEYTSGLVVVDHGMGLLSWYWNLASTRIQVYEGKVIEQGEIIGYNGGGGLSESYNLTNVSARVALTIHDIPVDPQQLIK